MKAETAWHMIQAALAAIGGAAGWFLGGFDGFMYALLAFVTIDYITGVMCAVSDKTLSSEVGFKGIFKKILIFVMVGVGHIVDRQIIGDGNVFRSVVIFFYLSNEGISLLENVTRLGLPVPEKLRELLKQLHKKESKDEQTKNDGE
jgi:toxin secretion/phage lysis holin